MNQYGFSDGGTLHEISIHEMSLELKAAYPDIDPLAYEASMHLVRAFGTLTSLNAPLLESVGLTGARMSVLALLNRAANKWLTIGEVASGMNVTSGNVTQVVNGLAREGLARRLPHPTDKRTTIVEMTAKGQQVFNEVRPLEQRQLSALWAGLTDREKTLLTHLLAKLRMNLLAMYADEDEAGEGKKNRNRYFRRRGPFRV
jgi:DNA-binding MarR family transcriptional regulator